MDRQYFKKLLKLFLKYRGKEKILYNFQDYERLELGARSYTPSQKLSQYPPPKIKLKEVKIK